MKGILLPADGVASAVERSVDDERDQLRWMYEVLGCSTVEMVYISNQVTMWVDEEGLLQPAPVLNRAASALAGQPIAGTALLLGGVTRSGTTRGLTDVQVTAFLLEESK